MSNETKKDDPKVTPAEENDEPLKIDKLVPPGLKNPGGGLKGGMEAPNRGPDGPHPRGVL